MNIIALGFIAVPTPGIPVALPDPGFKVAQIVFSQSPVSAGITYFGTSTLNKTTGAGVLRAFIKPSTTAGGFLDQSEIGCPECPDTLVVGNYAIDAATAGDGLFVYLVQR